MKKINFTTIITSPNPIAWFLKQTLAVKNLAILEALIAEQPEEESFRASKETLIGNVNKQGWVITTSLVISAMVFAFEDPSVVLDQISSGMFAQILGALTVAWFVITFASVKAMFLDDATDLTYFMFTAFTTGWMLAVTAFVLTDSPDYSWSLKIALSWVVLYAWIATAKYDSIDALRVGLDELAQEFFSTSVHHGLKIKNQDTR